MYLSQIVRCNVLWNVIYLEIRHSCMVRVCPWRMWYRYIQCRSLW